MSEPTSSSAAKEPSGFIGIFNDPSTLAATGFIVAVMCSAGAGLVNFLSDAGSSELKVRLLQLTDTVDIGDVAVLGIAIVLLLLTPDPPGGVPRPLLMQADAVVSALVAVFGVVRALVLLTADGDAAGRVANFVTTMGVAIAAATVAFWAVRESLRKEREDEAEADAAAAVGSGSTF